ncbi:hypothetical protein ACFFS2_22855 [Streptomyces aurantiacus]|uniref:Uncharacterized protein n=1 Tax=Streptomyces aurantiacus TaxID=47760 RepID=A0A7G1P9G6_9ACTN|nr:hypothetical protein [Streptomyces aurantiacus]BCL31999.1 hypothetical protein GCM10017557_68580 [Streptomyces aurantiacus]
MTDSAAPRDSQSAAQLADALMKVSVLDDLEVRRICVVDAMERLKLRLSVAEFDDKKIHIVVMVRAFASVPDGWRHLTEAVQHLADYDLPSRHAAALAHPVVAPLLDEPGRDELSALLAGLDRTAVPELAAVWYSAAGDHFGPLPESVHTAWDAHQLLAHTNRPADGAPRTLRFLQELAVVLTPERGDAIRSWTNRNVRTTVQDNLEAQWILDDSRTHTGSWRAEPGHPAHLLIRLAPSTGSPDRIDITCWANSGPAWAPRRRDERSVPVSEVRRHVATVLDREEIRLRAHRGGLILEFILPFSLVNEPVEEWSRHGPFGEEKVWDSEFGGPSIGHDYKVVVRSLERIEALQLHRVWNERWDVLTDAARGARMHRCEEGDGARHERLYARLTDDPAVVLMTLGSPPDGPHGKGELLVGLQAGLPLVLWSRSGPLTEHAHTLAESALDGRLSEALDRLTRLRSAPRTGDHGGEGFTGPRIAVLWDDPNRLPEVPEPIL